MFRLPFLEDTTPPPFYQPYLSDKERMQLDKWFIGTRSQAYYLKRFGHFDKVGKLSARWNWSAFLTTFGWLPGRIQTIAINILIIWGLGRIRITS